MPHGFVFSSPAKRFGDYQFLGVDGSICSSDRAWLESFICKHGRSLMSSRPRLILSPLGDQRAALIQLQNGGTDHAGRPDRIFAQGIVWNEANDRVIAGTPLSQLSGIIRWPAVADDGQKLPQIDHRLARVSPHWRRELLAQGFSSPEFRSLLLGAVDTKLTPLQRPRTLEQADAAQAILAPEVFCRHHWALPSPEPSTRPSELVKRCDDTGIDLMIRWPLVGRVTSVCHVEWWFRPPTLGELGASTDGSLEQELLFARLSGLPIPLSDLPLIENLMAGCAAAWLREPLLIALSADRNEAVITLAMSKEKVATLLGSPHALDLEIGKRLLQSLSSHETTLRIVIAHLCRRQSEWDRWHTTIEQAGQCPGPRPPSLAKRLWRLTKVASLKTFAQLFIALKWLNRRVLVRTILLIARLCRSIVRIVQVKLKRRKKKAKE